MVRLGIICEDESGKIILESLSFKSFLIEKNIELVNVKLTGAKNQFFADRYIKHRDFMMDNFNPDEIIAFFDLDLDICLLETKKSSSPFQYKDTCVIADKELESWFLADSNAISKLLKSTTHIEYPEDFQKPTKEIIKLNKGKGFGRSKPRLAQMMINRGFTIKNAAQHPNCPSAKYFIEKLELISKKYKK